MGVRSPWIAFWVHGTVKTWSFGSPGVVFIGFVGASGVLGIVSARIFTQFWSFGRPAVRFAYFLMPFWYWGSFFSGFSMPCRCLLAGRRDAIPCALCPPLHSTRPAFFRTISSTWFVSFVLFLVYAGCRTNSMLSHLRLNLVVCGGRPKAALARPCYFVFDVFHGRLSWARLWRAFISSIYIYIYRERERE